MEYKLQEEHTKVQNLEDALKAVQSNDQNSIQNKIIEITKKHSILDINFLRLARKYQSLEEQERMLRREYHNKDEDMAEKDRFVQQRINKLKEWKARALQ